MAASILLLTPKMTTTVIPVQAGILSDIQKLLEKQTFG